TVGLISDGTGSSGLGTTTLTAQTLTVTAGSVYRLAAANTLSATFSGNYHVGDTVSTQALSLTNTAANDGFSEKLNASFTGSTGGASGAGSINLLAAGSSDSSSLLISIDTSTAGNKSGTVTV